VAALTRAGGEAQPLHVGDLPGIGHLDRYADQWISLLPPDPALRAQVASLIEEKYGVACGSLPRLGPALGVSASAAGDPAPERPGAALEDGVEAELEWTVLPSGETLFPAGGAADSLYIVVTGRLAVLDVHGALVAEIGPGETVGEMALLTGAPRSATVRAIRDSELVRLSRTGFERLVERQPRAALAIAQMVGERLKKTTERSRAAPPSATLCLVPCGRGSLGADFGSRLAGALARHGSVLHLTGAAVDRELEPGAAQTAPDDPENGLIAAWLCEMEARHAIVLYETDPDVTPWTRRCLRQADRVLLVAPADGDPAVNPLEERLLGEPGGRRDLVLLRASEHPAPGRAARWLAPRRVAAHHHVGERDEEDLARLARFLTGRAVGLALSGGGARGYVHIGAIRAMREAGIPIDAIAGTSMGACVGAMCALRWPVEAMIRAGRKGFVRARPLVDYTVPLVSLLSGRRLVRILRDMFGEICIEDLPLKYFCVSADLTTGAAMAHEQGLLRKYLRASMGAPGLFPPVADNGSLLVDGGLLNNLPADLLERFCDRSRIVAVNCNPRFDLQTNTPYGDSLSAGRLLWSWVHPFGGRMRVPNIHQILERTTMLGSIEAAERYENGGAGLYLHPPTDTWGLFDFDHIETISEHGYRLAVDRIRAWKETLDL
jgi:NTE family protein/lysophospholipid hydrolase